VYVQRIHFPPSDALRLNRDGPPLSRLFFVMASADDRSVSRAEQARSRTETPPPGFGSQGILPAPMSANQPALPAIFGGAEAFWSKNKA